MTPLQELCNAFEFEDAAGQKLDPAAFREVAGSDRRAFDRITFRPRLMVNTMKLDLSVELFGETLFAPIIVAPIAEQKRFHADGELALVRGVAAAKAAAVISSASSFPLDRIAGEAKATLWYQLSAEEQMIARAREAVKFGCKALCVTPGPHGIDLKAIGQLRGVGVPVLLKGIMSPAEADAAARMGVDGLIVSSYGGHPVNGAPASIEVLPAIVEAAGARTQILIDGSFRRGSDLLKALALGARAVMIGRPAMWGLAAYGAAGVQRLLEMLQTELARDMAMCGCPNVKSIDRAMVRIHRPPN